MDLDKILSEKFPNNEVKVFRTLDTFTFLLVVAIAVDGNEVATKSFESSEHDILDWIISTTEKYLAEKI